MYFYYISFLYPYKQSGRWQVVFVVVCIKFASKIETTRAPQPLVWITFLLLLLSKAVLCPIYLSDFPRTTLHNAIYESC